jgi:hypothetical protein
MVHPYLNRRQGRERVDCLHPSLESVLQRTLGVPLFQEQLLRMAMIAAGFSGGEAEELRRAMGFKRSEKRMAEIEVKLRAGMTRNGIAEEAQQRIIQSITSFALYGFPESHAASFALLAYASAYLKCHYLAAFMAAMLNNQPMGFYAPAQIVRDAVATAGHCGRGLQVIAGGRSFGIAGVSRSATLEDGRRVRVSGDAAILQLASPLPADVPVAPIGDGRGDTYTIAGYGTTDERSRDSFERNR